MLPALRRLPELRALIDQEGYFVVHAPRQVGKTTALRSLAQELTDEGRYVAVHLSMEMGNPFPQDVGTAELAVLQEWRSEAHHQLPAELQPPPFPDAPAGSRISAALTVWAESAPRPLVVFLDEVDALRDETLLSVLRQLRSGYPRRPQNFPSSMALIGLRDVRDYKVASDDRDHLGTASPFNIKVRSLTLRNFTADEVAELYAQHTAETGQRFEPEALALAFESTQGQPWLVNSLAKVAVEELVIDRTQPIRREDVERARSVLIARRETHLDSLTERLREPRVRAILEPVLAGTFAGGGDTYQDDLQYTRDLGLCAPDDPVRVANPIYQEMIARVLAGNAEPKVVVAPRSFVLPDGRLDFTRMLEEFAAFWREHGEVLAAGMTYHEVAPQLVLMAFLHRVINGGGQVDREYGVGRGRIDLLVRWPYQEGGQRRLQRHALELKVWREGEKDPLEKGLAQLDEYLTRLGLDEGVLVIFDRRTEAGGTESRTRFEQARSPSGRQVTVLRA
ncbi:ATP-binding protein [Myxococcus sp. RHSTA-1-4]|uniref:ATP-binding protein n=1 Tax=Myxococcus sp. RHSTA-1-4 TaxID=2874601 RepID=UPI00272E7824|nr:ATP-binding protein [Myxococcus sp. RHSTA-1-4]